jgi:membrane protein DedA with SNARE-associated domain
MVSWIVRLILAAAGAVAGWFVTVDSASFQLVQLCVGVLLIAFIVFVLAFWPERWSRRLNRKHKGTP